jgi:hypothetical protein
VRDIIVRRYGAAWDELREDTMPVATALALIWAAVAVHRRVLLLAPVGGDPAWFAAICGGLAAGVVGSLVEDSGPVLLLVAVVALGCVLSYLWAGPAPLRHHVRHSAGSSVGAATSSSPGIGSIGSGP